MSFIAAVIARYHLAAIISDTSSQLMTCAHGEMREKRRMRRRRRANRKT